MSALAAISLGINYENEIGEISKFLQKFTTTGGKKTASGDDDVEMAELSVSESSVKYMEMLQAVADRKEDTVTIGLDDVRAYENAAVGGHTAFTHDKSLAFRIEHNAKTYVELFSRAIDQLMPESTTAAMEDPDADVLDVIYQARRQRDQRDQAARRQQGDNDAATGESFPAKLTRRYTVVFAARAKQAVQAVRGVGASQIGHLVTVRGIVTRVSDVRPAMSVAAYVCDACGSEVFQEVKGRQFLPLEQCASARCVANRSRGRLHRLTRGSRLIRFQEVKVQEQPDQVPMGDIPRTLTVHCYEGTVRQLGPGDVAHITGVFLPQPYTGMRALRAGLLADTLLEAHHVQPLKRQYDQLARAASAEQYMRLAQLRRGDDVYGRVSRAIAPEIFGHEDVKKALLLLLVGAPTKRTGDGMAIRGDINVCLMGDPGVAKSQLLRFVAKAAARGVYTTGRGSSGVGLTAAVARDAATGETVLEGGALVLADHGVCAIDEFDKMDEGDRTAIHEVMEQQTISVAKAGITTTLNARTSILAAANPARSRYNPRLTPEENINLPAALLSRFDVLFLMLDRPNHDDDLRMARHVAFVHTHGRHPRAGELDAVDVQDGHQDDQQDGVGEIDMELLRLFVADARARTPTVPRNVADYVVGAYVQLRQQHKQSQQLATASASRGAIDTGMGGSSSKSSIGNTTPRTLLGILRLAQARARVRGQDVVGVEDVDEALRLMDAAQVTLDAQPSAGMRAGLFGERTARTDPVSAIFQIVARMARQQTGVAGGVPELRYSEVLERVRAAGFNETGLAQCLRQYEEINVLQVNLAQTKITFVAAVNE